MHINLLKNFTLLSIVFLSISSFAFAINDVSISGNVDFSLATADTAAPTTITALAGGQVTNFDVQANYIDITLDNLSTVTFNTTVAGNFLKIAKQSGSDNYTITPTCPTTTATMAGTGAQVVLRLQVLTTDTCPIVVPPSGGGGGGGGRRVIPLVTTPSEPCTRTVDTPNPFLDTVNHWAEPLISTLYRRCIVDGKTPTLFAPDDYITRAELVKIVLNTRNLGEAPFENRFLDVFEIDWFAGYVINAAKRQVVIGYVNADGTSNFKPNQYITRAEALKVILRAKGLTDFSGFNTDFGDVNTGDWFYKYVAYAQAKGIIEGYIDTNDPNSRVFKPNNYISRAEASKIDLMVDLL